MKLLNYFVALILLFLSSNILSAGTYSGGTGTSGDPYKIATLDDLIELSSTTSDWASGKYFIQTAYIDATSTSSLNSGEGFVPIGNFTYRFKGNYDG